MMLVALAFGGCPALAGASHSCRLTGMLLW
jgi:hypothetical protein